MLHYNLEAILAVGYRVRSPPGVQFRQWASLVAHNLCIGSRWDDVYKEAKPYIMFPDNHIERNEAQLETLPDLTSLQAEAVARIPGFEPTPLEKIGLYKDKFREKLPSP